MKINTKTRLHGRVLVCFGFLGRGVAERRAMSRVFGSMVIYGTFAILEV